MACDPKQTTYFLIASYPDRDRTSWRNKNANECGSHHKLHWEIAVQNGKLTIHDLILCIVCSLADWLVRFNYKRLPREVMCDAQIWLVACVCILKTVSPSLVCFLWQQFARSSCCIVEFTIDSLSAHYFARFIRRLFIREMGRWASIWNWLKNSRTLGWEVDAFKTWKNAFIITFRQTHLHLNG